MTSRIRQDFSSMITTYTLILIPFYSLVINMNEVIVKGKIIYD